MSQDPLASIRRLQPRQRGTFPDAEYNDDVLIPFGVDAERLLADAAIDIFRAHAIVLGETRTIEPDLVGEILSGLDQLPEATDAAPHHPLSGLVDRMVKATRAEVTMGTAYEEVSVTAMRMVLRDRVLNWASALLDLREAIREMAGGNLTTLLLATANGQVVQPTSLGHYLTGHLAHLGRSMERIVEAYTRLNQSPLGSLSGVSTAMPVRRSREAELLGFNGIVDSTFDAIASADVFTEPVGIASIFATETMRLVNDLSYWSRDDVGVLTPGDELVHSPGAQPQRRDPAVLDHLRGSLARLVATPATVSALLANQQMLGSEVTRYQVFFEADEALGQGELICRLLSRVIRTSVVNRSMFANRSHRGFSTSSELADLLMVDLQLGVDQARSLAERIVVEWTQQGGEATNLTTEFVDRVALREIGRELGIEQEMLAKCLSPKRFVERRDVPGGPAPRAVNAALDRVTFALRRDREWLDDRRRHLASANDVLRNRAGEVTDNPAVILRRNAEREPGSGGE